MEKYLQLDWKPRRAKLNDEQQAQLLERARAEDCFGAQAEAIAYLQAEFAVSYTPGGICILFQRLKIKIKEPRPRNQKASAEEQAA